MARFAGDIFSNRAVEVAQKDKGLQDLFREIDAGETLYQQKIDMNEGNPYETDPEFIQEFYPQKNKGATLAQLTPSMMDPLLMDDDELEIRGLGVPQIRSLDYEKSIIKTPSAAGANYYYDQARPGGRHL